MGFVAYGPTVGTAPTPLSVALGGTGAATAAGAASDLALLSKVAGTPNAGFALQNATPTIISWSVPNDGNQHRFVIVATINVTLAETGGTVTGNFTIAGIATTPQLTAGGSAAGIVNPNYRGGICDPNTTVSVVQSTALTAGAAVIFVEIWAL